MKQKVLVSDALSDKGLEILKADGRIEVDVKTDLTPEQLIDEIKNYDALVVRSGTTVTDEIIEAADKLKVIGRAGVGVDNVDVPVASKKGIIVMNAPSGNTLSTAELTISMLMSLTRNIPQAHASMKNREWNRKAFMGTELFGKTLGILGFGRIGREVAKRMLSFGMNVVAYDPYASAEAASTFSVKIVNDTEEVFQVADFITVHTPLTDETRGLINKDSIAKMKDGVRIVNCARGGIVDEQDLSEAIISGKVAGAAFDVYEQEPPKDSPLYDLDTVVMTPHLGASTKEAQENVAIDVANQVVEMLLEGNIKNAVNFIQVAPEIYEKVKPFMNLSEKLGVMLSSLNKGRYIKLEIHYSGDLGQLETRPLTMALLKGLLSPILQETVNYVNSSVIAKERGIEVSVEKSNQAEDFANLISVSLTNEDGQNTTIAGTTFGKKDSRIVRIDGHHVDVQPKGYTLVCKNEDVTGFVGAIGTVLGENSVNIANLSLGREVKGDTAVTVFNLDSEVSDEVLEKVRAVENLISLRVVQF